MELKLFLICLVFIGLPLMSAAGNIVAYFLTKTDREALGATNQWIDASDKLDKWVSENPFYSETDPAFQELIRAKVGAYMRWLDTHPYSATQKHNQEQLDLLMRQVRDYDYD